MKFLFQIIYERNHIYCKAALRRRGRGGEELCNYFNLSYFGTLKDLKSRRSDFNKERKMNQLSVDGDPKKKHFIID